MIEWFLVMQVMSCGNCNRAIELAMPSLEICRVVRDLNDGSKCVMTDYSKRKDNK
jgi:hypothetical protein